MTSPIDRTSNRDDIVAIASRASLYAVLLSALGHQRQPQVLPEKLYADVNLVPPLDEPGRRGATLS